MREVPRRKALWFEVLAICAFVVPTAAFYPFAYGVNPFLVQVTEPRENVLFLLWSLGEIAIVLFILWASGDGWTTFGFRRVKPVTDGTVVLVLTALLFLTSVIPYRIGVMRDIPPEILARLTPSGPAAVSTALVALAVAATGEEILFRGYLIPRLTELTGNVWVAVVVSAALFGSCHAYQGWLGVFVTFGIGLALGIGFVVRPSIWPLAVVHFAYNVAYFFIR